MITLPPSAPSLKQGRKNNYSSPNLGEVPKGRRGKHFFNHMNMEKLYVKKLITVSLKLN